MTDKTIYKLALETWGLNPQFGMMQEECAELIAIINKYHRGCAMSLDVAEEVADVEIMIEQMRCVFGDSTINEIKRKKLARLEKLIEGCKK